ISVEDAAAGDEATDRAGWDSGEVGEVLVCRPRSLGDGGDRLSDDLPPRIAPPVCSALLRFHGLPVAPCQLPEKLWPWVAIVSLPTGIRDLPAGAGLGYPADGHHPSG